MKADIAVLCYNEEKNIPSLVETLGAIRVSLNNIDVSILLINNGSKDNTEQVIIELEKTSPHIRHVTIPVNQGYGFGVRTGLDHLSGDVVGYMWGDNQFDPAILKPMLEKFVAEPDMQVVKTYRTKRFDGKSRLFISKMYQIIFRILYGIYTHDINSGPKLFRREFLKKLQPLRSNDWFIDAELMIKATKKSEQKQIYEFPITFHPRKFGKSNVRLSTCFQFLYNLVKYKFVKL